MFTTCVWEFGDNLAYISQGKTFCTNTMPLDLIKPLNGKWDKYYHDYPTVLTRKIRLREHVLSSQVNKTRQKQNLSLIYMKPKRLALKFLPSLMFLSLDACLNSLSKRVSSHLSLFQRRERSFYQY